MSNSITKGTRLKIILSSIVVAIVSLRDTDCTIDPGLDAPFRWALNYFIAFDRSAFAYIQYTVGPLCVLKWPVPMGDHMFISTVFYLVIGALFSYLYTMFYVRYRETEKIVVPVLASMALLLLVNVDFILLAITLLGMLYYRFLEKKEHIIISLLITVVGVYIKTSLFVLFFSLWITFSIYLLIRKQYGYLLRNIITGLLMFFILGVALIGSVSGFANFALHNILFALKYSDLLSLYPHNNWTALGVSLVSISVLFVLFARQAGGFVLGIGALCLFAGWKYAMGREDFLHALTFPYVLIVLMSLFLVVQKRHIHTGLFLFLSAIVFYNYNLQNLIGHTNAYYWLPDVITFKDRFIDHAHYKDYALDASRRSCAPNVLPAEWQRTIGRSTVDVFPWDLSIAWVNGFTYRPRPCLQSQRLATQNDRDDAASLAAADAPQYIIWHATKGPGTNIDGLDQQYIPNTCPATMVSILGHYRLTKMANDSFAVWARRTAPAVIGEYRIDSLSVKWWQWVDVPACDSNYIIRGRVDYKNNLQYALRSFVYKGVPVFMEYETDSGKIYRYSFSKQCSREGLFLNPLWTDEQLHFVHVKRVRFFNDMPGYFAGHLTVLLDKMVIR